MHDEVNGPRFVAARDLAVADNVGAPLFTSDDSCKTCTSAISQIKPEVVIEWASAIGTPCILN
jgi:hypothetical protein